MKQKYRNKKRKFYFTPTPKVTGVILSLVLITYSSVFAVKHLMHKTHLFMLKDIKITGIQYLDEDEIRKYSQEELDKPLFGISTEEISKDLLENKYIRAVSVSRHIPSTLLIDIQERKPVLFLLDKALYMVDDTGIMLKKPPTMPAKGLPIATGITVNDLLQNRQPLYQALDILEVIKNIDKTLLEFVSEVNLQRDDWPVLFLIKGGAKIYLGNSDHYKRIYLWSELFQQTDILSNLDRIKKIDFTFKDRVVIENKT
jgi:cell division septal protein FtsQ